MTGIFDLVFEYRSLSARAHIYREALGASERARLRLLRQIWRLCDIVDGLRGFSRLACELEARFRLGGDREWARVTDVSAMGARLELRRRIPVGTRLVLSIVDRSRAVQYKSTAIVVWSDSRQCGVQFIGMPMRIESASDLGGLAEGVTNFEPLEASGPMALGSMGLSLERSSRLPLRGARPDEYEESNTDTTSERNGEDGWRRNALHVNA